MCDETGPVGVLLATPPTFVFLAVRVQTGYVTFQVQTPREALATVGAGKLVVALGMERQVALQSGLGRQEPATVLVRTLLTPILCRAGPSTALQCNIYTMFNNPPAPSLP